MKELSVSNIIVDFDSDRSAVADATAGVVPLPITEPVGDLERAAGALEFAEAHDVPVDAVEDVATAAARS